MFSRIMIEVVFCSSGVWLVLGRAFLLFSVSPMSPEPPEMPVDGFSWWKVLLFLRLGTVSSCDDMALYFFIYFLAPTCGLSLSWSEHH